MKKKIQIQDILLFFAVLLKPIYLFNSGSLQISDLFLILFFISCVFSYRFRYEKIENSDIKKIVFWGGLFVIWIVFINTISFIEYNKKDFLNYSLFYLFNYISIIGLYIYFYHVKKENTSNSMKVIDNAIILSVVIEIIYLILFSLGSGIRLCGTFNNPNQLGYYGLLTLIYTLLFLKKHKLKYFTILGSIIMIAFSLSKAAILGTCIMLVFYLFFNINKMSIFKKILIIIVVLCSSLFIYFNYQKIPIANNFINRVVNLQSDDSLSTGRGYNRVSEIGIDIIWGTGEGFHDRFIVNHEIHSTFVGILCNYGIIGFYFFVMILYSAFKRIKLKNLYSIIGIFVYWITHQGIRVTTFWIILFLYVLNYRKGVET